MRTFMTEENIVKSIGSIERSAGKLQDTIHKTAVSVLKLMHDKKIDGLRASELLTNVQAASPYHSAAFAKWVAAVTPFTWSAETKRWIGKADDRIMGKEFMYARDTTFWSIAPPAEPKPFDLLPGALASSTLRPTGLTVGKTALST